MRMGAHSAALADSLVEADHVFAYVPEDVKWDVDTALAPLGGKCRIENNFERLLAAIVDSCSREEHTENHLLVMSNGGFNGIHDKLLAALA